jgi:hypothetical protein
MDDLAPATLPVLAFCPDKATEHKGAEEAHQQIEKITDGEGMKEFHRKPFRAAAHRSARCYNRGSGIYSVRMARACSHKSPNRVRFRANQTECRHRQMTDDDRSPV